MNEVRSLLARLDDIGRSLERSGHALALIGLGSVGVELSRLDAYSDLDFFAVVDDGFKPEYLESLDWLESVFPIAYRYRNTRDGHKVLFRDGILCEFAVFERAELGTIPFARGRIVWKKSTVDDTIGTPRAGPGIEPDRSVEWLLGEALTNLYVGLSRFRRGEKLSASRLVQCDAIDRLLELASRVESETSAPKDPFAPARRLELRYPNLARILPRLVQGYDRTPESAREILGYLASHFDVDPAMAESIRRLCGDD